MESIDRNRDEEENIRDIPQSKLRSNSSSDKNTKKHLADKTSSVGILIALLCFMFLLLLAVGNAANVGEWDLKYFQSLHIFITSWCALSVSGMLLDVHYIFLLTFFVINLAALSLDVMFDFSIFTSFTCGQLNVRAFNLLCMLISSLLHILAYAFPSFLKAAQLSKIIQIFLDFALLNWLLYRLDTRGVFTFRHTLLSIFIFFLFHFIGRLEDYIVNDSLSTYSFIFVIFYTLQLLYLCIKWLVLYARCTRLLYRKKSASYSEDYYMCIIIASITFFGVGFFTLVGVVRVSSVFEYQFGLYFLRILLTVVLSVVPGRIFRQEVIQKQIDSDIKTNVAKYLSHELRSPLTAQHLGLEMLLKDIKKGKSTVEILSSVEELIASCEEANDILDNLILFEKLNRNTLDLSPSAAPLVGFVCETLSPLAQTIQSSNIIFNFEDIKDTEIFGAVGLVDAVALKRQLQSLIMTAVRSSRKSVNMSISVLSQEQIDVRPLHMISVAPSVSMFQIKISTDCIISARFLSYFNSDSITFDRVAVNGGSGAELRVYVLKKLIELHGGHIGTSLTDTGGVCMHVDLPIMHTSDATIGSEADIQALQLSLIRSSQPNFVFNPDDNSLLEQQQTVLRAGARVLVVDDSAMVRRMEIKMLHMLSYSCAEADDGIVAVEMMKTEHFDAVLLDNEMPIMRGRDAVLKMREMGYTGYVLGVTGNVMEDDVKDFIDCGADDVALKPLTIAKFTAAMKYKQE